MKKKFMLIISLILSLYNCSRVPEFKYKDQLVGYMEEIHKCRLGSETIIIIITGSCTTCEERTGRFVDEIAKSDLFSKVNKYIIIPDNHNELVSIYSNRGFVVILDKNFKLRRYGLDFDKNLLVHLKNSHEIKYWQWMYMENFYLIGKEYRINDL